MHKVLLFVFMLTSLMARAQTGIYLDITAHNDFFNYKGKITDKYYTGGHRVGISFRNKKRTDRFHSIAVQQKIYTPSEISDPGYVAGDYPYNGFLYLSYRQGRMFRKGRASVTVQVDAGTTGASSGAGKVQTGFHKLIHDRLPMGWHDVLELGELFQVQIDFRRLVYHKKGISLTMLKSFQTGTVYNRLQFGMELKAGDDAYPYLRQRGAFATGNGKKNGFYFFASPVLSYVHRNRMFDTRQLKIETDAAPASTGLETEELVGTLNTGFVYFSPGFQLTLSQYMNTPEFRGATNHTYGEIGLQFRL